MLDADTTAAMVPVDPARAKPSPDLWSAVAAEMPLLEEANRQSQELKFANLRGVPGLFPWFMSMFALGWPSRYVKRAYDQILEDQAEENEGQSIWPVVSRRYMEELKRTYPQEWEPIQQRIADRILDVGVMDKGRRLLALQRMFEAIEPVMWEERDKLDRLYLLDQAQKVLKQIAEEMGQFGQQQDPQENVLAEIALALMDTLGKIGGTVVGQGGLMIDVESREVTDAEAHEEAAPAEEAEEG